MPYQNANPKMQFFDANGNPLAGGKVYTYAAGTTTPLATYTDRFGVTLNTNPVILDSRGEADIWFSATGLYLVTLKTALDVLVYTVDNMGGLANATNIAFTPHGNLTSTDVQAALAEEVDDLAASSGASLVGYLPAGAGALPTTVQAKLRESVSVLDFYANGVSGAAVDPTGAIDSTLGINAALATGKRVYVPNGTYQVNGVMLPSESVLEGESQTKTIFICNTNNGSCFTTSNAASNVFGVSLSNLTLRANISITGVVGFKAGNTASYIVEGEFTNIISHTSLLISYSGLFIYGVWSGCRDGYYGTAPLGQTHQAIYAYPAVMGQTNDSNLNRIVNCKFFSATNPNGAVHFAHGRSLVIDGCDFEQLTTRALLLEGMFNVAINNTWFENVTAAEIIKTANTAGADPRGVYPLMFINCHAVLTNTTTSFINVTGNSKYGIKNCFFLGIPASVVLAIGTFPDPQLGYSGIYTSGAGSSAFLTGAMQNVDNANFSNVALLSGVISDGVVNAGETQNQNIFPLGPTGLGQVNFTNNGFTSKTDVASTIGLASSALRFTLAGAANAAYYSIPAKLVEFLRGRTLTFVFTGYGSGTGTEKMTPAYWEDVATPARGNQNTAIATVGANVYTTSLNVGYVKFTVGGSATTLAVGWTAGGTGSGSTYSIESAKLLIGDITPISAGLN